MIFDRIRLQLKLNQKHKIRQLNAEQFIAEVMDSQISWHREEILKQARLPLMEFTEIFNKMQAEGLIEVKQDGPPRHYQPQYSLTIQGRRRARHNMPRS